MQKIYLIISLIVIIFTFTAFSQTERQLSLWHDFQSEFQGTNTTIGYQLPAAGEVSLKIYNLEGQLVRTLVQSPQTAGFHQVQWDATDDAGNAVAAGIYLCQMQAGVFRQTQRLVLLK